MRNFVVAKETENCSILRKFQFYEPNENSSEPSVSQFDFNVMSTYPAALTLSLAFSCGIRYNIIICFFVEVVIALVIHLHVCRSTELVMSSVRFRVVSMWLAFVLEERIRLKPINLFVPNGKALVNMHSVSGNNAEGDDGRVSKQVEKHTPI